MFVLSFLLLVEPLVLFVFPQQQNAMGSLHNIDFCVFWASWGGSGYKNRVPGTGSGNWFREPFDGF